MANLAQATNGSDYSSLSGTVTIPSGSSSVALTLIPIDDSLAETDETVTLTISDNSNYFTGSPVNATVTVHDNEPTVSITTADNSATEGSDSGTFTITRAGNTNGDLVVLYNTNSGQSGAATNGTDYSSLSGTVTIPSGSSTVRITVAPIDDSSTESDEPVTLTIVSTSPDSTYFIGTAAATVTIHDNDFTSSSVTYLSTDASTQGNWKGVYGQDGYNIVNNSSSYPSGVTVTPSGNSSWTWASSTSDVRGLEKADPDTDHIGATWYSNTNFSVTIDLGGSTRQVALYMVDWEGAGRSMTVDVLDGTTQSVLDSRTISFFSSGKYLVYEGTGTLIFRFTNTAGISNAVLSGILFGEPGSSSSNSVTYLSTDTSTQGNWKGIYGGDGYDIINSSYSYPSGVTITPSGNSSWIWASSTSDVRGLVKADPDTDHIAATWYSSNSFTVTIDLGSTTRQVAFYLLDWESAGRSMTVDVLDGQTESVLDSRSISSFSSGKYLVYEGSGTLIFSFTNTAGTSNAVLSGIFFDPVGADSDGLWTFNSTLNDSAGSNNGGFNGGASPTYDTGRIGNAIDLDGTDDYVNIPYATDPSEYTIMAWVKPTDVTNVDIISRTDGLGSYSHQLRINSDGKFEHFTWDGAARIVTGTTTVQANTWYHVAIVATSGGSMKLYVNGQEEANWDYIGTLWTGGDRYYVGDALGSLGYFDGLIDDLPFTITHSVHKRFSKQEASPRMASKAVTPTAALVGGEVGASPETLRL